jgi:hypothetical protein
MARITAGVAASHVLAIGAAIDQGQEGTDTGSRSSTDSPGPVTGSARSDRMS